MFLNFGRDVQAEEVLKDALSKNPSNIPVQLKLLSIYANRKDVNAFSSIARQLKDSGDAAAWEQAAALGRAVDPSNPMYGGTGGAVAADILPESGMQGGALPAVDMDIGFNIPMDLDVTAAAPVVHAGNSQAMDFDVSGHDVTSSMDIDITGSHAEPVAVEAQHMDFDVTGSQPGLAAAHATDFDVTGSHPSVAAAGQMDFDVTGSHPNVAASNALPEADMGTVVLDAPMDFDISSTPSVAGAAKEEASSVMDIGGMDFDVSASPAAASLATATPLSGLEESGGMDFDISASPASASPAAASHMSGLEESGGMDFDISSSHEEGSASAMDFDISSSHEEPSASGMDFDISSSLHEQDASAMDIGLGGISLDLDTASTVVSPVAEAKKDERWQEVATKLDLARAYQEMGDADGAREILGEVLNEGDEQQIEAARALLLQL